MTKARKRGSRERTASSPNGGETIGYPRPRKKDMNWDPCFIPKWLINLNRKPKV